MSAECFTHLVVTGCLRSRPAAAERDGPRRFWPVATGRQARGSKSGGFAFLSGGSHGRPATPYLCGGWWGGSILSVVKCFLWRRGPLSDCLGGGVHVGRACALGLPPVRGWAAGLDCLGQVGLQAVRSKARAAGRQTGRETNMSCQYWTYMSCHIMI